MLECREKNLYRNRKVPREHLYFDDILKPSLQKAEKRKDKFDDDIIRAILERGEIDEDEKPLKIFSESLKGYITDVKDLQKNKEVKESV